MGNRIQVLFKKIFLVCHFLRGGKPNAINYFFLQFIAEEDQLTSVIESTDAECVILKISIKSYHVRFFYLNAPANGNNLNSMYFFGFGVEMVFG